MESIIKQTVDFAIAMGKHVASGMRYCTPEEIASRLTICKDCDQFTEQETCQACGCNCNERASFVNKLALPTEGCPLGKWKALMKFTPSPKRTITSKPSQVNRHYRQYPDGSFELVEE